MLRVLTICLLLVVASAIHLAAQANDELVDTVIGFLTDSDKEIRAIALEQIRSEVKGAAATSKFASELPKLSKDAQVGLLSALGDRGDATAKAAVVEMLTSSTDDTVRVAAVAALGKLGDTGDCQLLVSLMSDPGQVGAAARRALIRLQGEGVSEEIVQQIDQNGTPLRISLIEILTAHRAKDTIPELIQYATGKDAAIRAAAMTSLGQLADPEHVPAMVKAVLTAQIGNERNAAEKNLMFVCNRIADKQQRADPLLAAMEKLSSGDRTAMLQALGRVGGKSALVEIEKAIGSRDPAVHMAGIRGISNWPDAAVADQLVRLAKTDKHPDHRRIARMSILRVAPLPDGRSDAEKLELLKTGMQLAANDSERNYGLKRAAPIRLVETLRFVLPFVDQPKYSQQACQSIVELAHDRQLRDDNKPEFHAALDKVIATTKDPVLIDRANRYKKGQTWVRPK